MITPCAAAAVDVYTDTGLVYGDLYADYISIDDKKTTSSARYEKIRNSNPSDQWNQNSR